LPNLPERAPLTSGQADLEVCGPTLPRNISLSRIFQGDGGCGVVVGGASALLANAAKKPAQR
jgi:hypothetical protein